MSGTARARARKKRTPERQPEHFHLPSVHLRTGDEGFDYEEDLYITGLRRRERIERTIKLTAMRGGVVRFEGLTHDVLGADEYAWFLKWLPLLMEEGNPDALEIMDGRARLEYLRQCRIHAGRERACLACGCSESRACSGGCIWATQNLCSRCVT